jgi:hypothetical protein
MWCGVVSLNTQSLFFLLLILYKLLETMFLERWGSSVSTVTRLRTRRPGFNSRQGQWWEFFSSPPRPDRFWGPHSLLSNGYRGCFPGVKLTELEADHSPSSNAEVKIVWRYTPLPQNVFMSWCLAKHRDNFTFYPCIRILLHVHTINFYFIFSPYLRLLPLLPQHFSSCCLLCLKDETWRSVWRSECPRSTLR